MGFKKTNFKYLCMCLILNIILFIFTDLYIVYIIECE